MIYIAIVVVSLLVGAIAGWCFLQERVLTGILTRIDAMDPPGDDKLIFAAIDRNTDILQKHSEIIEIHSRVLEGIQERHSDLVIAVSEGIRHVQRSELRVNRAVARAKERLEEAGMEDPGVEAESRTLHVEDGDGGHGSQLSLLPEDLGDDSASSVPGVTVGELSRARGGR